MTRLKGISLKAFGEMRGRKSVKRRYSFSRDLSMRHQKQERNKFKCAVVHEGYISRRGIVSNLQWSKRLCCAKFDFGAIR